MFLGEVGWIWRKVSKIQFFWVIKLNTKETFLHITVELRTWFSLCLKKLLSSAAHYVVWSICTLLCSKSIPCVFASGKQQQKSEKSLHPKTMSSFLNWFLPTEQAYYLALRSKWKLSHYYLWVLMRHFFGSLFQAWKFITTIIHNFCHISSNSVYV